jgi:triosephosphate isomerase
VPRTPIIAGNWKMNKGTAQAAADLINELKALLGGALEGVEIVVCPPYTALHAARQAIGGAPIALGAQDVFWKTSGAYTGQVSPEMLVDAGVSHVIIGHSERRGRFGVPEPDFTPDVLKHFGDTEVTVNRKARAALAAGLVPIVCVGETLVERQNGHTDRVVQAQVEAALAGISADVLPGLVFAYEPVWAIGTGEVCDAPEADRVCGVVRSTIRALSDAPSAEAVRVQYGGSLKPDNAPELLAKPSIDGGLIGGASLKAPDFAAVIHAARR